MEASQTLYELHIAAEGKKNKAYYDTGSVLTIGVGHIDKRTAFFDENTEWDEETIHKVWTMDLKNAVDNANRWLVREVPQNVFDATVDLIFNVGKPKTYMLKLNEGDFDGARDQILRWIYDNGKVYLGLVKRRFADWALFQGRDWRPFMLCSARQGNLEPLNHLIEPYGYQVVYSHKTNYRLDRIA